MNSTHLNIILTQFLVTIISNLFKDAGSLLSATRDAVLKALVTYLGEDVSLLYYTLEVKIVVFTSICLCSRSQNSD